MDPVSAKMAAQIVVTLLKSKTLRKVLLGVGLVWAMMLSFVVATPVLITQALVSTQANQGLTMIPSGACLPGWDGNTPMPAAAGLSSSQVELAYRLWRVAHQLGLGDEAAVVGLVTLAQESSWGADPSTRRPNADHDAGPMQQRVLPGWYGTLAQVNDPEYAFRTFFTGRTVTAAGVQAAKRAGVSPAGPVGYHIPGLVNIKGWRNMPVTQAAQAVQRSAFPNAYAKHERTARQLVSMFRTGQVTNGGTTDLIDGGECGPTTITTTTATSSRVTGGCPATGLAAERGLTPDALLLLRCGKKTWPQIKTWYGIGSRPGKSDHPRGAAIDIMIPNWRTASGKRLGKQIADWAVANHKQLGIKYVIWDTRVWNAERKAGGWRHCSTTSCYSGPNDTLAHRDHVHVSVYGNRATTPVR